MFRYIIMEHKCPCGKLYSHPTGLYKHRKNCIVYIKQLNSAQLVEEQLEETLKQDVVQKQDFILQLEQQEKHYIQILQEKNNYINQQEKKFIQQLEEQNKLFKQILEEKDKLLEEKDKRIEDQKQTIEFMKTITMQRPSIIQEQPPIVQEQTPAPVPEEKPVKKHFNLKEYINSRNPITIDEFYDKYKPTIEEYDNIFSMGFVNAIVTNFANYVKTYEDKCPIIITNTQYERLRIYLYTKTENKQSWIEYDRIDAQMYMKDHIVIRFVNKYQKFISVFNDKYNNCLEKPSNYADDNSHISKKLSLTRAINTAEQVSDKISRELAYKLSINRDIV